MQKPIEMRNMDKIIPFLFQESAKQCAPGTVGKYYQL